MSTPSGHYQATIIAVIFLLAGAYGVWTGIPVLRRANPRTPGVYQFGVRISKLIRGDRKTSRFEEEFGDSKKATRYGLFWLLLGILFLVGGTYLLIGEL